MYQLIVYIPETHLEDVKSAMFNAGAGSTPGYENCCWQTPGEGQFIPKEGSNPHIGKTNTLETVAEYKVELICKKETLNEVIKAMKSAHPYEEAAFAYWPIATT